MADFVFLVHFCFILFVIFGGFFVYKRRRLAWLHIPMVLWAAIVSLMGWICPLTPLENYYRNVAGRSQYETGFVEHYFAPLIYPEFIDYKWGVILGVSAIVWNLLIYAFVIYKVRKKSD